MTRRTHCSAGSLHKFWRAVACQVAEGSGVRINGKPLACLKSKIVSANIFTDSSAAVRRHADESYDFDSLVASGNISAGARSAILLLVGNLFIKLTVNINVASPVELMTMMTPPGRLMRCSIVGSRGAAYHGAPPLHCMNV